MKRSESSSQRNTQLTITIKYLSVLRDRAGRRQEQVSFPPGTRLSELSVWLEEKRGFRYDDRALMFILNGRGWRQHAQQLETILADGDVVLISMPVSGG